MKKRLMTMNRMKRTWAVIAAIVAFCGYGFAQSGETISEKFVITKGNGRVNIRKSPNTKSPKAGSLSKDETLPILAERNGWYQVRLIDGNTGWISQSVSRISDAPLDITKICDHAYGICGRYDEGAMWSVAQIQGTDMIVAVTWGSNMDTFTYCPTWEPALWLGKKVGNTLVFDQYVPFSTQYNGTPGKFDISPSSYTEGGYDLYYGDKYSMPDNQGGKAFRPSTLTREIIQKLFNGKQKKDLRLYLGPQVFGKKYADVQFG